MILLPTAYLGNLQYYSKLLGGGAVVDLHEHYLKQSWRNRCDILTAGGPVSLSVPVYHGGGQKLATQDIRIDYSKRWQHQHWQAIVSAYRGSPYFAHYEEEFAPLYRQRFERLAELNDALQQTVLRLLGAPTEVPYTDRYTPGEASVADLRTTLSPKPRLHCPDPTFEAPQYYQVFSDRLPFVPNLSIVDLLFCEGPASAGLLFESIRG